jgi:YesN/AraC family two-component response regulator
MKLLIADDCEIIRHRIIKQSKMLANLVIVGEADNGNTALEMFRKHEPDFMILDLRMPGLTGLQILEKIKNGHHHTRVCVLTNYDYPQYRKFCHNHGASYFLCKNHEFEKLQDILANEASIIEGVRA